jgi:hypothetical protein
MQGGIGIRLLEADENMVGGCKIKFAWSGPRGVAGYAEAYACELGWRLPEMKKSESSWLQSRDTSEKEQNMKKEIGNGNEAQTGV